MSEVIIFLGLTVDMRYRLKFCKSSSLCDIKKKIVFIRTEYMWWENVSCNIISFELNQK